MRRYFQSTGVLSSLYYWLAIKQSAPYSRVYLNANGSMLHQAPSPADPFAHWASYHYMQAGTKGYDCALAVGAYQYDVFTGNPDAPEDLADARKYVASEDSKYG